jgi:hypothetical protein
MIRKSKRVPNVDSSCTNEWNDKRERATVQFDTPLLRPVRFYWKISGNTVLADFLWEKNTILTEKNKLKSTDYKQAEQGLRPLGTGGAADESWRHNSPKRTRSNTTQLGNLTDTASKAPKTCNLGAHLFRRACSIEQLAHACRRPWLYD